MPEQAYLKLKVNEVIKKIGYVKERQAIRAAKRMINFEIAARGNKAAVNNEILALRVPIQRHAGIYKPTPPPAITLTEDPSAQDDMSSKIARAKHAFLVHQVHVELNQRRLKKGVLMEIKMAGLKNRVCDEIRKMAMRKELESLRRQRGRVILAMGSIPNVLPRLPNRALVNAGQPVTKQLYLKQRVNAAVQARGKQRALKQMVHDTIRQRARKAQVCREIEARQRQIQLKHQVVGEIRKRALQTRLAKLSGNGARWQKPTRSTVVEAAIRKLRSAINDRARMNAKHRELVKAIRQIGRARLCKKQINQIIETHLKMTQVVLEIKIRGQTVRNKDRVVQELRERARRLAREKKEREFSWRAQRWRLHLDLHQYFDRKKAEAVKKAKAEHTRPIDRYKHMPVARQMFLKMEINRHFRQRGRKAEMHRELTQRFRTVDLKNKLCRQVLEFHKERVWREQVRAVINLRALKSQINAQIRAGNWRLRRSFQMMKSKKPVNKLFTHFVLKDKYSVAKKARMLKLEVNKQIEKIGLQQRLIRLKQQRGSILLELAKVQKREFEKDNLKQRINRLKQERGSIILELAKIDRKQIKRKRAVLQELQAKHMEKTMLAILEHRAENKRHKRRRRQINQVLRQRELKTKVNREICQRREHQIMKKRMLQELRMVKLKMLVGRKIKQIGEYKRMKKEVVQTIQARGDKARVMWQIKTRDHWILNPRTRFQRIHQAARKARLVEQIKIMGHRMRVIDEIKQIGEAKRRRKQIDAIMAQSELKDACLKEIEGMGLSENDDEFEPFEWGAVEERQIARKSLVNEAVKSLFMKKQVNKMLELRARVVRQKARLNMELKMRVAKAKCVYEIWERAQARKHHAQVCGEILQRTNLAKCVQDIKHGVYYLRNVPPPVVISPLVMIKQQIRLKKVNTVIKQAGLKEQVHRELLMEWNSFIRERQREEQAKRKARAVEELKQRCRHLEVMNEIKTRQKQVYWKQQTCIIIKQGGKKIRVNKDIRMIARQRYLKKQINTLIKQGGLKARVQKEIRQLRMIADLKKQKDLKAKLNASIRQIAQTREHKRRVNCVIKQTGLKARCNQEVRRGLGYRLKPVVERPPIVSIPAPLIRPDGADSFHQLRSEFEVLPPQDYSSLDEEPKQLQRQQVQWFNSDDESALAHPTLARPNIDPARRRPRQRRVEEDQRYEEELEVDQEFDEAWWRLGTQVSEMSSMAKPLLPEDNYRQRNDYRAEGECGDGVTIKWPVLSAAREHPFAFDDIESTYGDSVSEKGLAVMKLVEAVTKISERRDKQEKEIRSLWDEIDTQKADFEKLNKRMVTDKQRLFQELEELRRTNETLTELLEKKKEDERLKAEKRLQERGHEKRKQSSNRQRQMQTFSLPMQETIKLVPIESGPGHFPMVPITRHGKRLQQELPRMQQYDQTRQLLF